LFIIVLFIDDFSRSCRFNNVVFYLGNFKHFFNMRMLQHNSSMQKRFRQIVNVKFKRRCRFYFEFWRFCIENDHHCCVKYENSHHFFVDSSRVCKIFRKFSNSFFLNDVNNIYSRIMFFDVNTFNKTFSISRSSFDDFDEFEQRKFFFRKEMLFFLFNEWFFRESLIISLSEVSFREKNFDISIAMKMLIDVDSNDDVSSNVNNWKISIDDEISFFIIDFETTFFLKLFNTCFRINILSCCFSSLFSNIYSEVTWYVT
jgi:hypothetical protein